VKSNWFFQIYAAPVYRWPADALFMATYESIESIKFVGCLFY